MGVKLPVRHQVLWQQITASSSLAPYKQNPLCGGFLVYTYFILLVYEKSMTTGNFVASAAIIVIVLIAVWWAFDSNSQPVNDVPEAPVNSVEMSPVLTPSNAPINSKG